MGEAHRAGRRGSFWASVREGSALQFSTHTLCIQKLFWVEAQENVNSCLLRGEQWGRMRGVALTSFYAEIFKSKSWVSSHSYPKYFSTHLFLESHTHSHCLTHTHTHTSQSRKLAASSHTEVMVIFFQLSVSVLLLISLM